MFKLAFSFLTNGIALLAADFLVQEFKMVSDSYVFLATTGIFTLINFLIRPVFKIILSPLIILTLGAGIIAVNALMLYILDFLTAGLTIDGIIPLFYAAIIIGGVGFIVNFLAKKSYS